MGRIDVIVLVVRRHVPQAVPDREFHTGGQELRRTAQEQGVVRALPQAARDAEHLHRDRYSFTRYSSASRLTSFASADLPLGSGLFQVMPKSVRSIEPARVMPIRSRP